MHINKSIVFYFSINKSLIFQKTKIFFNSVKSYYNLDLECHPMWQYNVSKYVHDSIILAQKKKYKIQKLGDPQGHPFTHHIGTQF